MPAQFSLNEVRSELSRLIRIALGCVLITALSIALTSSVTAQPLKQQIEEIDRVLPGESYTKYSPALAVQSWEMAAIVAHIQKPASCKTAKLVDTKVTAVQEKVVFTARRKLKQGRWSEIWTFDKCGKILRVRADFKADGRGTADGEFALAK